MAESFRCYEKRVGICNAVAHANIDKPLATNHWTADDNPTFKAMALSHAVARRWRPFLLRVIDLFIIYYYELFPKVA
jgi:hypothetical protein